MIRAFALSLVEYLISPGLRTGLGPLNGQRSKRDIVLELLAAFPIRRIVETGTYRGTTTRFLSETSNVPVDTVEVNPRYYHFARLNLRGCRNVTQHLGSSVPVLRALAQDPQLNREFTFFYLDAHWGDYLPLRDELEIILSAWPRCIAMIDDFRVPGDNGFGFDDYGADKRLDLDYLRPTLARFAPTVAFPSLPARQDTGVARGTVVLFHGCPPAQALQSLAPYS